MARRAIHQVEGGREIRRSLRQAGEDMQNLKDAHKEAAQIAATASADLAPERSGRLKNTIRAAGTATAGILRAGKKAVPYAGPIHWGWEDRNIVAQPFMADGAKNSEGKWLPVYEDHMGEIINRIQGA